MKRSDELKEAIAELNSQLEKELQNEEQNALQKTLSISDLRNYKEIFKKQGNGISTPEFAGDEVDDFIDWLIENIVDFQNQDLPF